MHDLVIRNGKIVDGSGTTAFIGDVAIDGGVITSVGAKAGAARREIDASGLVVTPGWVDIHTHYDGQVTWDPYLSPSSWHGVTTIVMGNCGVGFAPVQPGQQEFLIGLMEGVEDIPGSALVRRNQVGLGIVSRVHERDREDAARARRRRADAARLAAHLRDGRARRAQRGSDAGRHREDGGAGARFAPGRRAWIHHLAHDAASREEQGSGAGNFRERGRAARHRARAWATLGMACSRWRRTWSAPTRRWSG